MPIVALEKLGMSYGAQEVLRDVTSEISRGDRVGLLGNNGTGKTTLLRIIAGVETPTEGRVRRARGLRIAYLPQEPQLNGDSTLFDEVLSAFAPVQALERRLHSMEEEMEDTSQLHRTMERYHRLLGRYEELGGYTYKSDTRSVLAALGFGPEAWEKPVSTLSGGEKARASLARVVLESPDLLLLDEPTNHLDIDALEWLEGYLGRWKGSLVVATHDRHLLTKLPDRIWALEGGRLQAYRGSYKEYLKAHQQEEKTLLRRYTQQRRYIEDTEDFIRRYRAGQRHRQAKDREKKLDRLEPIEAPRSAASISFAFESTERGPDLLLRTKGLTVGFDGGGPESANVLFHCPDLSLARGERVALIGPNGCGKTTFLRVLTGEMKPLNGDVRLADNVEVGYLPQDREADLSGDATVINALLADSELSPEQARSLLGRFLFSDDDVFKRLGDLSGGELSRVALAKVAQTKGNLLLLDEPTNHLDIESREVLQQAMKSYQGTVVMVSHDRYLIDDIATSVWEVRHGELHVYGGNYSYYQARRAEETHQVEEEPRGEAATRPPTPAPRTSPARRERTPQPPKEPEEAKTMEGIIALEEELARIEAELAEASYGRDHRRIAELNLEYKLKARILQERLERWDSSGESMP
jgi:ATP-binding cassette subfamily F protein 3